MKLLSKYPNLLTASFQISSYMHDNSHNEKAKHSLASEELKITKDNVKSVEKQNITEHMVEFRMFSL